MENLMQSIEVAKIKIEDDEKEKLLTELNSFLDWLTPLETVDPGNAEPLRFGHGVINALRDDQVEETSLDQVRKAAPALSEGYYPVPTIIE